MTKHMKKQAYNPYLPAYEYIPDGEPHVFGDRVYIYGSHDRFDGNKFCMNHYVCYSAPVDCLSDWQYEGVIYRNDQDPRMLDGKSQLWAPDVARGKDGRYYLYYCPDDRHREIGVAVADRPAGQYQFLGLVKDLHGNIIGQRPGDTIQFDPGLFIDDGEIYLYSGNGPSVYEDIGKEAKGSVVMTLCDDMVTIKSEPKRLMPLLGEANGTAYEGHEFFEASSIRKINGRYFFIYSSIKMHELCYAVSDKPDSGYEYGGVIISNADINEAKNRTRPMNCFGNNHGSIEQINGQWYVFYHRHTNRTQFSRQGCAEKITFTADNKIEQVEMTSCGLNDGPLIGFGQYQANIVCHLYGRYEPVISLEQAMLYNHPFLTQDGVDYDPQSGSVLPTQFIANCQDGMTAVYRYFLFDKPARISVTVKGTASGRIFVSDQTKSIELAVIDILPAADWTRFDSCMAEVSGVCSLCFHFIGNGTFNFMNFNIY